MRAITLCGSAGLGLLALPAPAPAGEIESFWIPVNGNFHDPANWDGPVPDGTVTAVFDVMPPPGEANFISFDFDALTRRLIVRNSSVHLRLWEGKEGLTLESTSPLPTAPAVGVGDGPGQGSRITVRGGTLRGAMVVLGLAPGSSGTIDFATGPFQQIPELFSEFQMHVGQQGSGLVAITGGATVDNGAATLGVLDGSGGEVAVSGPGSRWQVAGALKVGDQGTGSVSASGTADIVSGGAIIGQQEGAAGEVMIDGTGTTWTVHGPLDVGFLGEGSLTVSGGGFVLTDSFATIGTLPHGFPPMSGGVGLVTVTGPASTWFVAGDLHASLLWQGTLNVLDGATVLSANGFIGTMGDAVVRGPGSVWSSGGTLEVEGTLAVAGGGLASAGTIPVDGVVAGDGTLAGSVSAPGVLRPGDPVGTMTIDGDLALLDGAVVEVDLAGSGDGEADAIAVTGLAMLDGTLAVTMRGGLEPVPGDCFVIVSAGRLEGEFDTVALPALPAPLIWEVNRGDQRLSLRVGPFGGDLDGDGTVGMTDLLALLAGWGSCVPPCPDDLTGDGAVDAVDLFLLLHGWGPC